MDGITNEKSKYYQYFEINRSLIDYAVHKNLEAILGFSMKRTDSRDDAEDLAQDIVTEVYRSYTKLKRYEGPEALEGWIWAIARHTYCRWLNKKKKNNVVFIEGMINDDVYDSLDDKVGNEIAEEEQLNILRREISMLSKNYRDIIVLYYVDDKTCVEISNITELPLSTVKWRLHEAKRIIKERMENMQTYTEKTYAPGNLWVRSAGIFNQPYSSSYILDQIKSLLRQNILLCIYRKPMDIKEISHELAVPVVYLEEELKFLLEEEFIKERTVGKYQTDFIIITIEVKEKTQHLIETLAMNIAEYLLGEVNKLEKDIRKIGFGQCDKPWEELMWFIVPYCTYHAYEALFKDFNLPMKPHGNSWILTGFEGTKKEYPWMGDIEANSYLNGKIFQFVYWTNSITYRAGFLENKEAELFYDWLTGKRSLNNIEEDKKEVVAALITKGFLVKEADAIKCNIISANEEQCDEFNELIKNIVEHLKEVIINEYIGVISSELKKTVPQQLIGDIDFVTGMLISEASGYVMKYLLDKKVINMPKDLTTSIKGMFIKIKNS